MKSETTESTTPSDDLVQISKTTWENTTATTIGRTTKVVKTRERHGWKAIVIRQNTFDQLKELMKGQDRSKKRLDLASLADGLLANLLKNRDMVEAGIAEGRARKRAEILAAANAWAD